jgi:hypothetical protein
MFSGVEGGLAGEGEADGSGDGFGVVRGARLVSWNATHPENGPFLMRTQSPDTS